MHNPDPHRASDWLEICFIQSEALISDLGIVVTAAGKVKCQLFSQARKVANM